MIGHLELAIGMCVMGVAWKIGREVRRFFSDVSEQI